MYVVNCSKGEASIFLYSVPKKQGMLHLLDVKTSKITE